MSLRVADILLFISPARILRALLWGITLREVPPTPQGRFLLGLADFVLWLVLIGLGLYFMG